MLLFEVFGGSKPTSETLERIGKVLRILGKNPAFQPLRNRICIFGSIARGDFTEHSDIDIMIDLSDQDHSMSESLIAKEGPAFEHDCPQCVFVGADHPQQGEPRVNQIDMYVHRSPSHTILIRRYGSEPSNYSSQEMSDRISPKYQRVWDAARQLKLSENRAPRFYHGSSEIEPVFRPEHTGTNSHACGSYNSIRHGIFFTNNPKFAAMYGKIGKYRLKVRRTLDLENDNNTIWNFVQSFDPHNPDERPIWLEAREIMFRNKYWQLFEDEVGQHFVAFLKDQGYDSATFPEYNQDDSGEEHGSVTTVVFDPSHVRRMT